MGYTCDKKSHVKLPNGICLSCQHLNDPRNASDEELIIRGVAVDEEPPHQPTEAEIKRSFHFTRTEVQHMTVVHPVMLKQSATIHRFPVIGTQVDSIMAKFWAVINELPDDTSVALIISALAITQFDVTEALRKKNE